MHSTTEQYRQLIRASYLADEASVINELINTSNLSEADRSSITVDAAQLVRNVRDNSKPTMMEVFLAEYGLTTKEGIALMCLAEALLRVPDSTTIDALIEDKVVHGNWRDHLGQSNSSLVNTSTWALLMTGKLLSPSEDKGLTQSLRKMVKRLGEPVVRSAVAQAMKELGRQFVLGQTITEATERAVKYEQQGYAYSYDMLGEAARTTADALRYHKSYADAISQLSDACKHDDIRRNPGISVKLSALHPRYEFAQRQSVMSDLVARTFTLAKQAKQANMGFNIDAEEADRLDLSLDVIEAVLSNPELEGWDGFGVVVQAFGPRTRHVIDWLYSLATRLDRKIMVRLVKGAYWDAEIKRAQVLGLNGFPVFTRKVNSDVSYIRCAEKLLAMTDRIYPQFATHNAHSVAAVLHMAKSLNADQFEFQRLHGMGESLHDTVLKQNKTQCRIYAPVGAHEDLLAYLVRRLLENGANSSFVNQIVDTSISPEQIAQDPFDIVANLNGQIANPAITKPSDIYGESRLNSMGWDVTDPTVIQQVFERRDAFAKTQWLAQPLIAGPVVAVDRTEVRNPADADDIVGHVIEASADDIETAISEAEKGYEFWSQTTAQHRAECLQRLADLYEQNFAELFALSAREAGKILLDAVGEIREAVDFARYYANEGVRIEASGESRGIITCISPWNFPLAIFSGQVFAALAAGNVVLAKPADQTALVAARAVELMHQAGIPRNVIQLLPGSGVNVGAPLTSDARISGVCFTGSTQTAQRIHSVMAESMPPQAPLVAETGGLNAMIVDSTALPEQVIRDVVISSFQSAGQRCSALRMLYLQKDIADHVLEMLFGAMDELSVNDPWLLSTDVGPVIDLAAKQKIENHCRAFAEQGRVLKAVPVPEEGLYVAPTVIKLDGIEQLSEEIFGPVLHVAIFEADELDTVIETINAQGYGLTFGLHTRVDNRVEHVVSKVKAGNLYVNRNQIGAVVGSQPFGGEGLSGTGPKAGGPYYVQRFRQPASKPVVNQAEETQAVLDDLLQSAIERLDAASWPQCTDKMEALIKAFPEYKAVLSGFAGTDESHEMPGPTGELNVLVNHPRGVVLCLGPDLESAAVQALAALSQGNAVVVVAPNADQFANNCLDDAIPVMGIDGVVEAKALANVDGFDAVASVAETSVLRDYRVALASRGGAILPLITEQASLERYVIERHLCVDTTAAGGNASLIAATE